MKELLIFGRTHKYEFEFEVKRDIRVMNKLIEKVKEPQILSYCGLESIDFDITEDEHFIGRDCIHHIYEMKKSGDMDLRKCLLACSDEDAAWTEERNNGYTGVFYRKISFNEEVQNMIQEALREYIALAEQLLSDMISEQNEEEEAQNNKMQEWKVATVYENVSPISGENGRDGYIDAEYTSVSGATVRMVSRDVFDFGCYSYPKRVEGTDAVFERETWSEEEVSLAAWLGKYGEFNRIRM